MAGIPSPLTSKTRAHQETGITLHPTPSQPLCVLVLPMAPSLGPARISWRLSSKKNTFMLTGAQCKRSVMCAGSERCA